MDWEPKTYLEKRVLLNENVLDVFMQMMVATMTPAQLDGYRQITDKWQSTIDKLNREQQALAAADAPMDELREGQYYPLLKSGQYQVYKLDSRGHPVTVHFTAKAAGSAEIACFMDKGNLTEVTRFKVAGPMRHEVITLPPCGEEVMLVHRGGVPIYLLLVEATCTSPPASPPGPKAD